MPIIGSHRTPPTGWVRAQAPPEKRVVYAPFSIVEAAGKRLLGTSWEPWKKYDVRRHGDSAFPLAFLNPGTTVYVVAHCAAGYGWVTDNAGNHLTASELADRIKADGLSQNHLRMKLYACMGGASGSDGTPAFATRLLDALKKVGYNKLVLYAYTATVTSVSAVDGHKYARIAGSNAQTRASEQRIRM